MSNFNDLNTDVPNSSKSRKAKVSSTLPTPDTTGSIAKKIGSGEDAKNSFVYLTILGGFIAGTVITIIVVANCWYFREKEKVPDLTGDIEAVWKIVIPLITLALGYSFGKNETKTK